MQTKSRDGKLIISAPDTAKTGCRLIRRWEDENTKFDKETDVYLTAVEGMKVTFYDVAHAIAYDCFDSDGVGLHLLAKKINCHLTVGKNKYEFSVQEYNNFDSYLTEIVRQFEL